MDIASVGSMTKSPLYPRGKLHRLLQLENLRQNGLVTWETQQTDYPRTRPDLQTMNLAAARAVPATPGIFTVQPPEIPDDAQTPDENVA